MLMNLLTVVVFLVMFSVLVAAHEYGHYLFARKFNMGVSEFAIGMGNPIVRTWKRKKYKLEDGEWDPTDRARAMELSLTTFHDMSCTPEQCRLPIGVIYREEGRPTYADGLPQVAGPLWKTALAPRDISATLAEMG